MRNIQTTYKPGASQNVAIGAASAPSTDIGNFTMNVRLHATVACYVNFEEGKPATTDDMLLAAGIPEYFTIDPGTKINCIQASGAGTLNITEMTQ
jgi:hypothetical protein